MTDSSSFYRKFLYYEIVPNFEALKEEVENERFKKMAYGVNGIFHVGRSCHRLQR
jgi:hypothetical protein